MSHQSGAGSGPDPRAGAPSGAEPSSRQWTEAALTHPGATVAFVYDPALRVEQVAGSLAAGIGLDGRDWVGRRAGDDVLGDERLPLRTMLEAAFAGRSSRTEVDSRTNGWWAVDAIPLYGPAGVQRVLVLGRPTEDDHEVRRMVRVAEHRYRETAEALPVATVWADLSGDCVGVNRAMCKLLGQDPAYFEGLDIPELVVPGMREQLRRVLADLRAGTVGRHQFVTSCARADGTSFWAEARAAVVPGIDGRPDHLIVSLLDVDDVVGREGRADAAEQLADALFESGPHGRVVVDRTARILRANTRMAELVGRSPEELRGVPFLSLLSDAGPGLDRETEERLSGGDIGYVTFERRLRRADGAVIDVDVHTSLAPPSDASGARRYLLEVVVAGGAGPSTGRPGKAVQAVALAPTASGQREVIRLPGALTLVCDGARRVQGVGGEGGRFGVTPEDALGCLVEDALGLPAFDGLRGAFDGESHSFEVLTPAGASWAIDVAPLAGGIDGAFLVLARDLTPLRAREARTTRAESRWRAIFEQAPVGMAELAADSTLLRVNDRFCEMAGEPAAALEGRSLLSVMHHDDRDDVAERLRLLAEGAAPPSAVQRMIHTDGSNRWVVVRGRRLSNRAGGRLLVHILDVTDEHEATIALSASNARFSTLIEHGSDLILILNQAGRVRYASPSASAALGLDRYPVLDTRIHEWLVTSDRRRAEVAFLELLAQPGAVRVIEGRVALPTGGDLYLEITMTNRLQDPAIRGIVCNCRDVTERVETAARLAHQALHDGLTGLPNRSLLLDRLEGALARSRRSGQRVALLFLDLDRFKTVNDSMGHAAGDEVLVTTASRLDEAVRPGDSVARLGGDEFVVLAEGIDTEDAVLALAERLRDVVAAPIDLPGRTVTVGTSVGVALSGVGDPQALLREADTALYRAKELGRGRWELYNEAMRSAAAHRLDTEELLRLSLRDRAVRTVFQPIIDLRSGLAVGCEALCRLSWQDGREVSPQEFIPVAEDSGLVVQLGMEVLDQALAHQAAWEAAGRNTYVAVNVSARQLAQPGLAARVASALRTAGVPSSALCLELTESSLIDGGAQTRRSIEELDAMGVALALDDFGTGWSSLSYLDRFPLRVVKIDRSFVTALGPRGEGRAIISAIVALATALGLQTVAEGVETEEQADALRVLGCDYAQGYLYARPGTPDDIDAVGMAWRH